MELNNIQKDDSNSVGFIPTMGALHKGHISLLEKAKTQNKINIVSIFVNPTQFNNSNDLVNYPRTIEEDIDKLEKAGCDIAFIPEAKDVYQENTIIKDDFNFGHIENVMEGKYRKGHFRGVAMVVNIFFELIKPNRAYFGMKDYQQLLIIKSLAHEFHPNIEIIPCNIFRENDGLAMSSRNTLLTNVQREKAPLIYEILKKAKNKFKGIEIDELKEWVNKEFKKDADFNLEYFEIADSDNLILAENKHTHKSLIAFVAVNLGKIRLIDNIPIN